MNTTISVQTKPLQFNFKNLLIFILVLVLVSLFFLSNYFTTKFVLENTPTLNYEDIAELAEEIHDAETLAEAIKKFPLNAALTNKMAAEILRQLAKTTDYNGCEVYFLRVQVPGAYPVLGYGDKVIGFVNLKYNDIWKVGMTKNGEKGRYSGDYFYKGKNNNFEIMKDKLFYDIVYQGTYKQVIVMEKILIYSYPLWSQKELVKPPGCKIFR